MMATNEKTGQKTVEEGVQKWEPREMQALCIISGM